MLVERAEVAERSNARDCKSRVRKGYSGSNPDLSTAFNVQIDPAFKSLAAFLDNPGG